MQSRKRRNVFYIILAVAILIAVPCMAAEQESVITLEKAKELVREHARVLLTIDITREKLEVQSDMAYDAYRSTNLQNKLSGYKLRIRQLSEELAGLDPVTDEAQINAIKAMIDAYEQRASMLKANMPEGSVLNELRRAWRTADDAYKDMVRVKENTVKSLDFAVERLYYALLNLQDTIEGQSKTLENLGKQLRIERLKIELGLSTKENENEIISQYNVLKNTLADLKTKEELLCWQLNDLMGREVDAQLEVVGEEITPEKKYYTVEKLYEQASKNSLDLAQKKRQIENLSTDIRKEDKSDQRDVLRSDKKLAETELVDLEIKIKEKIKTLNDQLNASFATWEAAFTEKEKAKLTREFNEIRYELGLTSELQKELSETAYLDAENKEKQAARAWQLAMQQLTLAQEGIFLDQQEV
jgi:outer membrane protein TolC